MLDDTRSPDTPALASLQAWRLLSRGSIQAAREVCVVPWILWLILSSYTLYAWIDCSRERVVWLEANGLTRAYMLDLAHAANLNLLTSM